jgi:hypothetical protein
MSDLGALLVFIVFAVMIGITAWLIIKEFKRVNRDINTTDETSRAGLSNLTSNVKSNYLLRGDFATASNAFTAQFASVASTQSGQDAAIRSVTSSNQKLNSTWNTYFGTSNNSPMFTMSNITACNIGTKGLQAASLSLLPGASFSNPIPPPNILSLTPTGAITMSNSMTGMPGMSNLADLDVPRARVGESLNIAGKLNFATANSSYMLGVDGTSMYLKMSDDQDGKFQIRAPNNKNIVTVNKMDNSTAFDGNINITGCIKQAGTGVTAGVCLENNVVSLTGSKVQIPATSQLAIGSYTFKEDAAGQLVVSKGNTDVVLVNPAQSNNLTVRNLAGGSHTVITGGSPNLSLVA